MNARRFKEITSRYASLRIAVVGDFCLDRYLEIDPARQETSIETGLPVHNVVNVRASPVRPEQFSTTSSRWESVKSIPSAFAAKTAKATRCGGRWKQSPA
jgi:hypothetical protein